MKESNSQHCISALQIHDWVTHPIRIKQRTGIFATRKTASDFICNSFRINCLITSSQIIWIGKGLTPITGTLTIKYHKGIASSLDIMVNGERAASIRPGQSFSGTRSDIQVVELVCREVENTPGYCEGDFSFNLHYSFSDSESEIDYDKTETFYSDANGQRINSAEGIECTVLFEKRKKDNSHSYEEIPVLLQGYITIQLFNKNGELIFSIVEPFSEVESFSLYYPTGTFAACEITQYNVKSFPISPVKDSSACKKVEFIIHITICLSVEVLSKVNIRLRGKHCDTDKIDLLAE